mmetsp:Transcript_131333/g.379935  ORF Transcript_131333/g.379935 Transcript_131333/m.379935 type:complete len:308 (-) Transcript_131333:50-973(-)
MAVAHIPSPHCRLAIFKELPGGEACGLTRQPRRRVSALRRRPAAPGVQRCGHAAGAAAVRGDASGRKVASEDLRKRDLPQLRHAVSAVRPAPRDVWPVERRRVRRRARGLDIGDEGAHQSGELGDRHRRLRRCELLPARLRVQKAQVPPAGRHCDDPAPGAHQRHERLADGQGAEEIRGDLSPRLLDEGRRVVVLRLDRGVVHENVDAAVPPPDLGSTSGDGGGARDVQLREVAAEGGRCRTARDGASGGEHHAEACEDASPGDGEADASAGAGYDHHLPLHPCGRCLLHDDDRAHALHCRTRCTRL